MGTVSRNLILAGALLFLLLLTACSSGKGVRTEPRFQKHPVKKAEIEQKKVSEDDGDFSADISRSPFVQIGVASWYGEKFQGRRTANGEIYDMYLLTAAHNTLPFNTIVEVENLENNRKTIVRINDRGPFVKNRVIDLSLKAARLLGMAEKGTARVGIRLLKTAEISRIPEISPSVTGYNLQAGAFGNRLNAYNLVQQLNEIDREIKFEIHFQDGYHRVLSERVSSREEAERLKGKLEAYGFDVFIRELY